MDAPSRDVWEPKDGKVVRFDCYPPGPVIPIQLGVLGNLAGSPRPKS
ncbi:hypothetical protein [Nocardia alni]|nr:hypothetical protein [Nocardia alni]